MKKSISLDLFGRRRCESAGRSRSKKFIAKIYYVGDWAILTGPLFAETPFNYTWKGTEVCYWNQYNRFWLNACNWLLGLRDGRCGAEAWQLGGLC